ncbi:MATE efflux family protein [Richelia sinica FACHB-800]|uniref:Probable multidrug resistance protein NorM n=1 Tax=Richelia sinica FACHB-800 TaxID=1357546 RepID=A0A975Y303_9NOST|nr:MATE family efflux transporter [Richelia sinica]MBD2665849.1 MATE family efflux transporter [Richelia sinica FACHB-800]QXE21615.1 MATE efflux family protein [Richelia sinica FACHB-800]
MISQHKRTIGIEVLRLALPLVGQSILETLIVLVDRIMLGHYSTAALASMRISGSSFWCLYSILSAVAVGTIALVGRAVGSGNKSLAGATARSSLLFTLVIGIAASVLCLLNLSGIIGLFPISDPSVIQGADEYLQIILAALPLMLLSIVAAAILQAAGDTRTPFFISLFANAINVVIDYILIFGHYGAPELGVRGAAIGSVAAMAINTTVLILILSRDQGAISWRGYGGEWDALGRVLRVSLPALGDRLFRSLGYLGFTFMIASLGSVAMAAHEAILGVEEICYLAAEGFGTAAAANVAQKLGAKQLKSATWSAVAATIFAVILQGIGSLAFILIPSQLLSILSPDPQIIATGIPCLYIAAIAQPFMAISIVLEQALRGAGATKIAFFVSLAGWLIVRLIATYTFVMGFNLGLVGVWLGSTCDWFVRAVVLLIVFKQGKWRETIV